MSVYIFIDSLRPYFQKKTSLLQRATIQVDLDPSIRAGDREQSLHQAWLAHQKPIQQAPPGKIDRDMREQSGQLLGQLLRAGDDKEHVHQPGA